MIQDGDYIRDRSNGHLHKVQVMGPSEYFTVEFPGGIPSKVEKANAIRVKELSLLPGEPEVLERSAP